MKNYYYVLATLGLLLLPMKFMAQQQYCTPTYSNQCGGGDFIDGVAFGTINNQSTGCANTANSYSDYTAMTTDINQSLTYNVTITNNGSWTEGFVVYFDWDHDTLFTGANEAYPAAGTTPGGGTETISVTVPAGATLGTTRMRVRCAYNQMPTDPCANYSYGETEDYHVNVLPAPPCSPATNLAAGAVLATSADISWDATAGATSYTVEWGPTGFTPGTGAQSGMSTGVTGTSTTISPLTPQTAYDVYVMSDCGGSSSPWSQSLSITTPCAPLVAPWTEDFTGGSMPACWDQSATSGGPWVFSGNPGWDASGTADHTNGTTQTGFAWMDHSGTDVDVILMSPQIDVSALNVPELRFWVNSNYSQAVTPPNNLIVEAFDGTTWQNLMVVAGNTGPSWVEYNVVIQPSMVFSGNLVQVRFHAESNGNSGQDYYNDAIIDDVSITEAPTCPAPTNLNLVTANADSAIFDWNVVGSETEWEVEYGAPGFTLGTGTVMVSTTNPDTVSGLALGQFYDLYLRAVCTVGDSSTWIGPIQFNTFNQPEYMEAGNSCGPGYIDISQTGTDLNLTDDSEAGITLPWPWLVQDQQVNQITVGNNGGVLLNTLTGQVGYTMNSGDGFYPFVLDLDNDISGVNQVGVLYQSIGTAPNRQFVILWKDRTRFSGFTNTNPCTFEMIYDEATNEVYYVYPDVDFGNPNYDNGADAEIGFRGNQDVTVSVNSPTYLLENECVHLYYTDCPKPSNLILQYTTVDEAGLSWTGGLSGETDWLIIYDSTGFDPMAGNGNTLTSTNPSIILGNLTQKTVYDVYIYALCANGDTSFAISTTFETLPFCSDVNGLAASTGLDSLIDTWSWMESDPLYEATAFHSVYGGIGFDPETEGTVFVGDTMYSGDTIVDPGFLAGGVYELYVQAVCGQFSSNYVGPITFIMPLSNDSACGAETLPVDGTVNNFSNDGATVQQFEQAIAPPVTGLQQTDGWGDDNVTFSTWFKFTAPASGQIRINATNMEFDGQVAVYDVTDCSDFGTFILQAANDDEIDGVSQAPNFTICGLTAGNEYYLMHDSYSTSNTGIYSLSLSAIDLEAGTHPGVVNVCSNDTVSLFSGITGNDAGGFWVDVENTFHIVDDTLFSSSGLAYQTYTFEYRLEDGCAFDSILAEYEVYPPSQAGDNGSITVCLNQPTGLLGALGGVITAGGTWFDTNGDTTTNFIPALTLNVPGSYNYMYTVGNDVCPDDTAVVTVNVNNGCDWLSIDDLTAEGMNVYPNPTSGIVNISNSNNDGVFALTVMDINGRIVYTDDAAEIGAQEYTVDLNGYDNGVYIIRLTKGNTHQMMRIVKQ